MKKSSLILGLALILAFSFFGMGCEKNGQDSGKIQLTIISKTSQGDWSGVERCTHYYSISGSQINIEKTPLPHNQTTAIELPKSRDSYKVIFSTQGVYADGKTPSKPQEFQKEFKGNKSATFVFTCELRGSAHGIESK